MQVSDYHKNLAVVISEGTGERRLKVASGMLLYFHMVMVLWMLAL